jgi:phosphoribosyl 1,2-cyclic phosphate phosphodiesterase
MRVTVLGTGTSTGVPLIHCKCKVCTSPNPKNQRFRASVWVETRGKSFLIDTSPDLRLQAIRAQIPRIDAILYTHPHADHVAGIDEVRSFNFIQKQRIPAYGNAWTVRELPKRTPYIFDKNIPIEGGGAAQLDLHEIPKGTDSLTLFDIPIGVFEAPHGTQEVLGFRFGSFAYLTDCHELPASAEAKLQGLDVFLVDCLRMAPHATHFHYDATLDAIRRLQPKVAYLTHLSHEFEIEEMSRSLPKGIHLAYDQLQFELQEPTA